MRADEQEAAVVIPVVGHGQEGEKEQRPPQQPANCRRGLPRPSVQLWEAPPDAAERPNEARDVLPGDAHHCLGPLLHAIEEEQRPREARGDGPEERMDVGLPEHPRVARDRGIVAHAGHVEWHGSPRECHRGDDLLPLPPAPLGSFDGSRHPVLMTSRAAPRPLVWAPLFSPIIQSYTTIEGREVITRSVAKITSLKAVVAEQLLQCCIWGHNLTG
mmetsp:Transcript_52583/g.137907  ORF Transcript_52583/g.137907 Transcript_52583/m.137907 type:complete len:216 (-) Transcript_52583:777-1424(-)